VIFFIIVTLALAMNSSRVNSLSNKEV